MTVAALPAPFSIYQGLDVASEHFTEELIKAIVKHLRVEKVPPVDHRLFSEAIRQALEAATPTPRRADHHPQKTASSALSLHDNEIMILKRLARYDDEFLTIDEIQNGVKLPTVNLKYHLHKLSEHCLVSVMYGSRTQYHLTDLGRTFLIETKII